MQEAPVTMRQWTAAERAWVEALPRPGSQWPYLPRYIIIGGGFRYISNGFLHNPRWKVQIRGKDHEARLGWKWHRDTMPALIAEI